MGRHPRREAARRLAPRPHRVRPLPRGHQNLLCDFERGQPRVGGLGRPTKIREWRTCKLTVLVVEEHRRALAPMRRGSAGRRAGGAIRCRPKCPNPRQTDFQNRTCRSRFRRSRSRVPSVRDPSEDLCVSRWRTIGYDFVPFADLVPDFELKVWNCCAVQLDEGSCAGTLVHPGVPDSVVICVLGGEQFVDTPNRRSFHASS